MEENFFTSQFTIGSVFSSTYATLRRNPVVFFSICFISLIPLIMGDIFSYFYPDTAQRGTSGTFGVINMMAQGALSYAVYQSLQGNTTTIRESLLRCASRMSALVGASILVSLGIGLGLLLLVIPGVLLGCMWGVSVQACVVENLGARESMRRSAELTKGHRLKIFFLSLIMFVVSLVVVVSAEMLAAFLLPNQEIIGIFLSNFIFLIPFTFWDVMMGVIYYRLREVKEGIAIDALANVFD